MTDTFCESPCPHPTPYIVALRRAAREPSGLPLPMQPGEPIVFGLNFAVNEALTQDWATKKPNAKPEATLRVHAYFPTAATTHTIG